MVKGIIVVDVPKRCKNCDFIREDFHGACCERKADGEGLCKEIPIEIIRHGKPDWCPINPIPERKVSTRDVSNTTKMGEELVRVGFNACLDEIEGKM